MRLTRTIALCALTIAIGLAIGSNMPLPPYDVIAAHTEPMIIFWTATPALPTPALALVEPPQVEPPQVDGPGQLIDITNDSAGQVEQLAQEATPACAPDVVDPYCDLPVLVVAPAAPAAPAYEPMTAADQQYSRNRTR